MEVSLARKGDWELTGEAFERLLRLLDSDRERAGEKYELARRRLIAFFEARGAESPADHADETLNRAARKVAEGERVEDINKYLYGVARLLLLELGRAREKGPLPLDTFTMPAAPCAIQNRPPPTSTRPEARTPPSGTARANAPPSASRPWRA